MGRKRNFGADAGELTFNSLLNNGVGNHRQVSLAAPPREIAMAWLQEQVVQTIDKIYGMSKGELERLKQALWANKPARNTHNSSHNNG
jgi:hypothetical protein